LKQKYGVPLFALIITALFILASCGVQAEHTVKKNSSATNKQIRIGYQKFGTLNILKAQGKLENRLKEKGYTVKWTEFPAGPQLLEALNVGSIDFGHTGEAPPIFAQAANAPLIYVANQPSNPKGEAIVVLNDSPIKHVSELKGKKVALNKGSNVHYLLVKALEKAGLSLHDIKPVYLPPADARTAFESGNVDAWVIWDPFLADAEEEIGVKILQDGEGLVENREFFLAAKSFAKNQSENKDIILDELRSIDKWVEKNPRNAAEFLSPQIGISVPALEKTLTRKPYGLEVINGEVISKQQEIADTFYKIKLIPKKLDVKDAVLPATK
jgi:sulfonate transport system substrate-binding protein